MLLLICKFAATFYMYIYIYTYSYDWKPNNTLMWFFRSIRVHLEHTWRKCLQSVWNHELFGHHKWTLLAHNWRKNHHFYLPSIGICHNFPHHFSSSQGILKVLIGLVLFCFWFVLGNFFFLFLLCICSSLSSICKFWQLFFTHLNQQSYDAKMVPWLHSQFSLLATHCWWRWDSSPASQDGDGRSRLHHWVQDWILLLLHRHLN